MIDAARAATAVRGDLGSLVDALADLDRCQHPFTVRYARSGTTACAECGLWLTVAS